MEDQSAYDIMGDADFGRAALKKLSPVSESFRIYAAELLSGKSQDQRAMKVTGAHFRQAKRGPRAGELCIPIPGTVRHVIVTQEEIAAAAAARRK